MNADARAEAERRYSRDQWSDGPGSRSWKVFDHRSADAFVAGAQWQASRPFAEEDREAAIATALRMSDDENHVVLCACDGWPESCVTYGGRRPWTHDAEFVARAALDAVTARHNPESGGSE